MVSFGIHNITDKMTPSGSSVKSARVVDDDITIDDEARAERDKVLRGHRKSAQFFSMAEPVLFMLGSAALLTAAAIGSAFISAKHHHRATFNSVEVNAQHTAKYIAKEMKKEGIEGQVTNKSSNTPEKEYQNNQRSDGKQWTQIVKSKETNPELSMSRH
ncbi:MAG: hypothetical protein R3D71_04290 [Rickettsiales bacterium]